MAKDFHQQLESILKKNKVAPIFPFLKSLTHEERRALVPSIKKLDKYYTEFIQKKTNSWSSRGTVEQNAILRISGFACFTGAEYSKWGSNWLDKDYVKKVFEFYIPEWFGDFVNKHVVKEGFAPFRMDYEWMMELKAKNMIGPIDSLITGLLPAFLFDSHPIKNTYQVTYSRNDAKLLRFPETLSEHIWLFFKEESNLHNTDTYVNYSNPKSEFLSWKQAFKHYADNGTIDRFRLLKESLSATTMNFNKNAVGWFIDLFDILEPTHEEMLKLQSNMMGVFNCPHSKPINVILKKFKKLCLEKGFLANEFLANTPILLSSETKTTVTSALMILDKLAIKNPRKAIEICLAASQALVSNDAAIQTRTAKIIAKYGATDNEELKEEVAAYTELLVTDAKSELAPFIAEQQVAATNQEEFDTTPAAIELISESNAIQVPTTLDDLIFLASEAFDNNDPLHFDIFPAALLALYPQLNYDNVDRFEPALQRAYKLVMGDWRTGIGLLDHMLANFFIDFCSVLIDRFSAEGLRKVQAHYEKQEKENLKKSNHYSKRLFPFKFWLDASDSTIYRPFYHKLLFISKEIKFTNYLPPLSTPTHHPFWIDPKVLIARVKTWQDAGKRMGHADMQLALSRTYLRTSGNALHDSTKDITGEPQRILQFLLEKEAQPAAPFETIAHWWTAAIIKNPETVYAQFQKFSYAQEPRAIYTGDYEWRVGKEAFKSRRWDYDKRKMVDYTDHHKILRIHLNPKKTDLKLFGNFLNFNKTPKTGQDLMLYKEFRFKRQWYETHEFDTKRFYGMVPNNPENLLAKICDRTVRHPEFFGETQKRMFVFTLEQLLLHDASFGKMAHLLVACGLICSDKPAKSLAGEVWIYGVNHHFIDSSALGTMVGQHFAVEFAPLKRFTDLIIESLLHLSAKHSLALQELLEAILLAMPETPIRGMKKLLEIYVEVIHKNKGHAALLLTENIKGWSTSKSLNPVLKKIQTAMQVA